ncbi:SDR family oxidoreductase [Paracrocinitomix mangrovi]|uniref:SDR family NAD(P)-dependent oxidoreductase n=1 Tax=Paracrocinitomix mangrovi TaxID=2862509 RepID=UPI001C8F0FE6|nr:SDR family oxidoreductase [Paracrocinitomix mangrovi]UKN00349.1 SDR family oxidoreductase [Paracrocinitomix mangrovi]
MKAEGKVIVVTGGGSGIGRNLVYNLINKGAIIAAADIHQEGLDETKANIKPELQKNLSLHIVDISDRSSVEAFPEQVIAAHGTVDGIINCAGIIQPFIKVSDLTYEQIERVMNINFYGTVYMTKSFLPHLLKRPTAHIVNIVSMGGFLPVPGQSIYGASKAAVKLMTEGMHSELMDTNVNVTAIFPGGVDTNIMANSGLKIDNDKNESNKEQMKPLPADEAARQIVAAMEKNKVRAYVGKDSKMMNFLYRFSPGMASKMIYKKLADRL